MTAAPLVFLDTETTGIHPGREVWEIAMIRRDADGEREFAAFVDVDLSEADPFGLDVGRFYERHPKGVWLSGRSQGAPDTLGETRPLSRNQAAEEVAIWTHGAHIVGAVPNFDTEVLDQFLRDRGYRPSWHYHLIDVENLAVGYLNARREFAPDEDLILTPPWDSEFLSRALGVDPGQFERHTAMGDARWARSIYDAVMDPGG